MTRLRWIQFLNFVSVLSAGVALTLLLTVNESPGPWAAAANRQLETITVSDRSLQRDLLSARAGLLRNYDALATATENIHLAAIALRFSGRDEASRRAAEQLLAMADRRESLVERFKSDNALIQNAVARISKISDRSRDVIPALDIASRVMELTLNTTPEAVSAVRAKLRLARKQRSRVAPELLVQSELLATLLPRTDAILAQMRRQSLDPQLDKFRHLIDRHLQSDHILRQQLQTLLFAVSCAAVMTALMLLNEKSVSVRLRKRQVESEQLMLTVSGLLVDARSDNLDERITQTLATLVRHTMADAAFARLTVGLTREILSFGEWQGPTAVIEEFLSHIETDRNLDGSTVMLDHEQILSLQSRGYLQFDVLPGSLLLIGAANAGRTVLGMANVERSRAVRPDILTSLRMSTEVIDRAADRQALEAQRHDLERQSARSRRMEAIGAMASGIAHNFNNIIGVISGQCEILERHVVAGSPSDTSRKEIEAASSRAADVIEDILHFAKERRGDRQSIQLALLVGETVRLLRAARQGGAKIVVEPAQIDHYVSGRPSHLQQVLINICNNAVSVSPQESVVRVTIEEVIAKRPISLSHGDIDAGRYSVVGVRDYGPGIHRDVLARVFEPFFTTRPTGTGLGMSTAWEIVQDHGGSIDVWSEHGVGSRFSMWLPASEPPAAAGSGASNPPPGLGERVLIVGALSRLTVDEEAIARLGYEAVGVSRNSARLRQILRDHAFDKLILVDPDNLIWFIKCLDEPMLPMTILALSARESMQPVPNIHDRGMQMIRYPFDPQELAIALSKIRIGADNRMR